MAELREWIAVERIRAKPKKENGQAVTLEQARETMKPRRHNAKA